MKAPGKVTIEETKNAVMKLDDFSPFPMARCIRRVHVDIVGHVDPERAQEMRAQRRATAMHAQHEDDRPALHGARNRRDPVAARRFNGEQLWAQHVVIHSGWLKEHQGGVF